MTEAYTAVERNALERALANGESLVCPQCTATLVTRRVDPGPEVAYVRRRIWVMCPGCRRTAGLDDRSRT